MLIPGVWGGVADAEQCPKEGLSALCCGQFQPEDDLGAKQGGYAWHPGPSDAAGLCQGYASQEVSGSIVSVLDFREQPAFSDLPDQVYVGYRTLAVDPPVEAYLSGYPYSTGNTYVVAGSFESGTDIIWETRPFMAAGQDFTEFGMVAYARHAGNVIYTPLVFRKTDGMMPERAPAHLVLRTNSTIDSAVALIVPMDAGTLQPVRGSARRALNHKVDGVRTLVVDVPPDVPESFVLSVVICDATATGCTAKPTDPPSWRFRILWPDP